MEPIILERKIFHLMGCVFYGNPFHSAKEWTLENEIGKLWNRFIYLSIKKYPRLLTKISTDIDMSYELHLEPEEYKETKNYYVMVGMEVNNTEEIPLEMFVKVLPKSNYVFFTTRMEDRFKLESQVYQEWIPNNGYEQSFPYIIEAYNEKRYKGLDDPSSEIDWFIPVKKVD
ncbi:MAG: GyrI-like domain-containing protein [Promethearchaeota archaeon]